MQDQRHPRPVIRARPGGSCKAIHDVEFSVGDSYHVVSSERDDSTAWGHLARSEMLLLPAIAAGPHGGPGPIRAPSLGDDASLRGAPLTRAVGPIKVGAWPFVLSLSVLLSLHELDFVISGLCPPSSLLDSALLCHCWTLPSCRHHLLTPPFSTQVPPFTLDGCVSTPAA